MHIGFLEGVRYLGAAEALKERKSDWHRYKLLGYYKRGVSSFFLAETDLSFEL